MYTFNVCAYVYVMFYHILLCYVLIKMFFISTTLFSVIPIIYLCLINMLVFCMVHSVAATTMESFFYYHYYFPSLLLSLSSQLVVVSITWVALDAMVNFPYDYTTTPLSGLLLCFCVLLLLLSLFPVLLVFLLDLLLAVLLLHSTDS